MIVATFQTMFPSNELYLFTGCICNVLYNATLRPMHNPILIYSKNDKNRQIEYIYLGKFLKMENHLWTNREMIQNGLAMFEHGTIEFPHFHRIQISLLHRIGYPFQEKRISSTSRTVSWKENDDCIVQYADIYHDCSNNSPSSSSNPSSSTQSEKSVYDALIPVEAT